MRRRSLIVLLLVVPLALSMYPAAAQQVKFTAATHRAPQSVHWGRSCTVNASVWAKEYGLSGVRQFKYQFEMKSPQATANFPFYIYRKGYYYSTYFPNDALSYAHVYPLYNGTFAFPRGGRYSLWVKAVGVRPSFWQADLVRKIRLSNHVGCERIVSATG